MLLSKLKEVSARTNLEFPYGRTMLHPYLVKVGSQDQKADNHKFIMKIPILVAWRCKYLIKVQKYREGGYLIVYLDSTQLVFHYTLCMLWSDGTKIGSYQDDPQE